MFNGLPGATSEWDNQFYVQFLLIAIDAAIVVYNTENVVYNTKNKESL